MEPEHQTTSEPQDEHEHEDDPALRAEDVDEEINLEHDNDTPMDEDDEDGDREAAGASGEMQMGDEEQQEFEDTSIAAFYSHRKSLFCVSLHPSYPNPPLAISGGEDDGGWIWDTREGADVVRLGGHTDSVTAVGWNAAGDLVATGGMDGRVRVWRRVGSGDQWNTWEFLTNLDGPDEVVVSSFNLASLLLLYGSLSALPLVCTRLNLVCGGDCPGQGSCSGIAQALQRSQSVAVPRGRHDVLSGAVAQLKSSERVNLRHFQLACVVT